MDQTRAPEGMQRFRPLFKSREDKPTYVGSKNMAQVMKNARDELTKIRSLLRLGRLSSYQDPGTFGINKQRCQRFFDTNFYYYKSVNEGPRKGFA